MRLLKQKYIIHFEKIIFSTATPYCHVSIKEIVGYWYIAIVYRCVLRDIPTLYALFGRRPDAHRVDG